MAAFDAELCSRLQPWGGGGAGSRAAVVSSYSHRQLIELNQLIGFMTPKGLDFSPVQLTNH
jgi:hypothetical protein